MVYANNLRYEGIEYDHNGELTPFWSGGDKPRTRAWPWVASDATTLSPSKCALNDPWHSRGTNSTTSSSRGVKLLYNLIPFFGSVSHTSARHFRTQWFVLRCQEVLEVHLFASALMSTVSGAGESLHMYPHCAKIHTRVFWYWVWLSGSGKKIQHSQVSV